jgi:hypothetical protein
MLRKNLKKAIEMIISIHPSLFALALQLLSDWILIFGFISFLGGWSGIFPDMGLDERILWRLVQMAWGANLIYILSLQMSDLFESTISVRWLVTQNRLENWIVKNIPSLSLAQLTLKISKAFANIVLLDLYIYFCSSDYKYLMGLTNTYSDRFNSFKMPIAEFLWGTHKNEF